MKKCEHCNEVWYYPLNKCIYCDGNMEEVTNNKLIIKGVTQVFVPSKDHMDVPYYNLLLENEYNNFVVKKTLQEYKIGDIYTKKSGDHPVNKETIGIVGTGTLGFGIATSFLDAGFKVILKTRSIDTVKMVESKINRELLKNLSITTDFGDLKEVGIIIESVIENFEVKKKLFDQLEKHVNSNTIIATNTSSFSINKLSSSFVHPERFAGMHFFNPVAKMRLVEIILGEKTNYKTERKIFELSKKINKTAIITKDSPCFIVNRILMVYLNEAAFEYFEGVSSIDNIDTAIKLGLNHPIGPFALADLIGIDVVFAILTSIFEITNNWKYFPCPIFKEMIENDKLGRKTKHGFYSYK